MYIAVALENYKIQVSQITKTSIQSLKRALEQRNYSQVIKNYPFCLQWNSPQL